MCLGFSLRFGSFVLYGIVGHPVISSYQGFFVWTFFLLTFFCVGNLYLLWIIFNYFFEIFI
jgi:hypothetical protein